MWNTNLKELETIILLKEVKGRKLKITIYPKKIEEMNWSWDSLNFLCNEDEFATVEDIENNDYLILTTDGDTEVYTIKKDEKITDEPLKFEDIESIVKSGEVYNENKYLIENKNHFSLHYYQWIKKETDKFQTVDVSDFQFNPKTIDELIEILEDCFIHQFGEKTYWITTDEYQRVKKLSETEFLILETTDLSNTFPGDKFSVTKMFIDIDLYNIETDGFYEEYLKPYGYKSLQQLKQMYLTSSNQIIAEIISETDSYNEADVRTHCDNEQEVLEHLENLIKEHDDKNN